MELELERERETYIKKNPKLRLVPYTGTIEKYLSLVVETRESTGRRRRRSLLLTVPVLVLVPRS